MPPHRSDSRVARRNDNWWCLNMHLIPCVGTRTRLCATHGTLRGKWTNFRRLQFCGVRERGFAPRMSRLPKPDYGYTDFTVFYRTCNLVLLRDSTDNKIAIKRIPIPPPHTTHRLMFPTFLLATYRLSTQSQTVQGACETPPRNYPYAHIYTTAPARCLSPVSRLPI